MYYPIAVIVGAFCLAVAAAFVMLRPVTVLTGDNSPKRHQSTLIADAPPPEDQGTPGRRS